MESIIGKEFPKKVIPLIDSCKKSLKIIVFDWRWYPNDPSNPVQLFNQAIIRASRRGVAVEVITNFADVVNLLNSEGCKAIKPITKNLIHAKMMIIDGELLILGSHNYTQSAFTMNYEVSVLFDDKPTIDNFLTFFNSFL